MTVSHWVDRDETDDRSAPWTAAGRALTSAARGIALAQGPVAKLQALRAGAASLAIPVRHGFIARDLVIDRIYQQAENCGLIEEVGEPSVAEAIQAGLDDFTPANGHEVLDEEPPPPGGPEDYGIDGQPPEAVAPTVVLFRQPSDWPSDPPPPVDWLAHNRIPAGDVTTVHGDGGAGKTDIALQLAAACARGRTDWLGTVIMPGPAVFLSAEEPEAEIRRRLWRHGERDGFHPTEIGDLHFWFPDDIAHSVLAVPDRSGVMRATPLFEGIQKRIVELRPVLVVVDNVAATYVGEQNARVAVRTFINLWRSIARQSGAAVVLLDHPSLSGMTNGTGRGGNMDWRNSVRSALYLRLADDKVEADCGVRVLETVKSNYGPIGNPVRLIWRAGGLALEGSPDAFRKAAHDQEAEQAFLRLLDERTRLGLPVSPLTGRNYAPAIFAEMEGNEGYARKPFARAMERLLTAGTLVAKQVGPPSRAVTQLMRSGGSE